MLCLCGNVLADCDKCMDGKFQIGGDMGLDKGQACQTCEHGGWPCDGIAQSDKDMEWYAGSGDIIRSSGSLCAKNGVNKTLASSSGGNIGGVWLHGSHVPVLLDDGLLEGKHFQLDLGRSGQCAADAFVRLLGMPLEDHDPKPYGSVGECCDRCHITEGCKGWVMDGIICSLLGTLNGTWSSCDECIAGVHIASASVKSTFV